MAVRIFIVLARIVKGEGELSEARGESRILEIAFLERMNDNVVISEVDAVMDIVLSEAEKHLPYGEVEFITFQLR